MPDLDLVSAPVVAHSAQVSRDARLGNRVRLWDVAQVREHASIGSDSTIGRGVYIDHSVTVGERCKIQNGAQVFFPARIGDGVVIGPGAILTNDPYPRSVTPDGDLKDATDWDPVGVTVEDGASLGAGSILLGGVTIGRWAVVGAGATVIHDVAPYALVVGTPARRIGWVGRSGGRLASAGEGRFIDHQTGDQFSEQCGRLEVSE